jgi:protein-glutamine gamma-glutamyltransferase
MSLSSSVIDPSHGARRSTAVAIMFSIIAFSVADAAPALAVFSCAAVLVLHRLGTNSRLMQMPRWALNVLLLVVAGFAATRWMGDDLGVSSFARFLIAILLVKLLDRKKARDEGQLLTLAAFLALATALTNVGLLVGLMLLLFVPVLIDATVRVQLMVARESGTEMVPGFGERVPMKRLSLVATVGVTLLSMIVFVLVPRQLFEGRMGEFGGRLGSGTTTGFADQVSLGGMGIISVSQEPVFDLRLEDSQGNALGGAGQVQYLRGAVLDVYSNGRWTASDNADRGRRVDVVPGIPTAIGTPPLSEIGQVVQHVVVRRADRVEQVLFAVWRPYQVQVSESGVLRQKNSGVLRATMGSGKLSYTIWSSRLDSRRSQRTRQFVEPMDLPRINEFARRVLIEGEIDPDPEQRSVEQDGRAARLLEEAVRNSAVYTLNQPPVPVDTDPTEWFLFDAKRGHCEYFASALAVMCRAVGIDARVVAGYVAMEFNPASGHYLVRESNAHAWVEAAIGGGVWLTLDPTPPADLRAIHTPSPTLWSRLSSMLQAAEYAWVTRVVDFGGGSTAARVNRETGDAGSESGSAEPVTVQSVLTLGLAGLLIAAALMLLRGRRLRAASQWPAALVGPWTKAEQTLRKAGMGRPSWRPLREHAQVVRTTSNEAGDILDQLIQTLYNAKYGLAAPEPADVTAFRDGVDRLQRVLASSRTNTTGAKRPDSPE